MNAKHLLNDITFTENEPISELLKHSGSVTPRNNPEDFQEIRAEFENSVTQEVISEDNTP